MLGENYPSRSIAIADVTGIGRVDLAVAAHAETRSFTPGWHTVILAPGRTW